MPERVIDIEPDGPDHTPPGPRLGFIGFVIALVVLIGATSSIASWTLDYAWWTEMGQIDTWWRQLYVHTAPIFFATIFAYAFLFIVHSRAISAAGVNIRRYPFYRKLSSIALLPVSWLIAAAQWGSWDVALWLGNRGAAGSNWKDPVFGNSLEFYFFELPFYRLATRYCIALFIVATLIYFFVTRLWALRGRFSGNQIALEWSDFSQGAAPGARYFGALALLAMAVGAWWGRYTHLYDDHPFLTGADYVGVNIDIPLATAWAAFLVLGAIGVAAGRNKVLLLGVVIVLIRAAAPSIVNSFYVRPNEITLQKPYIEHHLAATRQAFGLKTKFKEVDYKAVAQGKIDVVKNKSLLENVRLWDWKAFHDTVSQIQPLRPYTFVDTDVDRYRINGKLQQVLLSPRELEIQQLGEARNRWPNRHVIYTHGYGVVAADANRITPDGLPQLFIQDAPPKVTAAGLKLTRPEIYFGEVEHEPVFVRTAQPEFNYPSGSDNVHNTYDGTGGIPVGPMTTRLAAAVAYGDWNIILTSYLKDDSRMMIRRRVADRLETLAPYLRWEQDPYLVITEEGRLVWMVDGFTASSRHPYSERISLQDGSGVNYIRNSVKATVDAYTGEAKLYVFDAADPYINAYRHLFPALFLDAAAMPAGLRAHSRYPEWLFRLQAEILLTYHMTVPEAFYNKVDAWDVARRSDSGARGGKAALDANYMVAQLPREAGGTGQDEFLLMLPFTPRGKDNLVGMLIARCDGDSLGELVLMQLPKEELFFGPLQVESRINQDQNISKDLTLWNQQGSSVLNGQMAVVPIDNTFLYVQPIYLQAAQARMPQLKKVALAFGNELIYADTYEQALAQLGGVRYAPPATPTPSSPNTPAPPPGTDRLETARQLMEKYRKAARDGQWAEAGKALEALDAELKKR